MKKLITTCVMLAAISTVSLAQTKKPTTSGPGTTTGATKKTPEMAAQKKALAAQKAFGLNSDQYNNIYNVELTYERQVFDLAAIGETPSEGRALQLNLSRDGGYKYYLTAEQYAKYETNKNP